MGLRQECLHRIALSLTLAVCVVMGGTATSLAQSVSVYSQETYEPTVPGLGLQVASWAFTVPYGAAKIGYALAGVITGGLAYLFSGANVPAAQAVWTSSIYGDYLVRPEHLTGDRSLHFLGRSETSAR